MEMYAGPVECGRFSRAPNLKRGQESRQESGIWQNGGRDAPVKIYNKVQPETGVRQLPLHSVNRHIANGPIIPDLTANTGSYVVPEGSIVHVPHDKLFVIVLAGWSIPAIANELAESFPAEHTTQTLDDGDMRNNLDWMALQLALLVSFFRVDDAGTVQPGSSISVWTCRGV